MSEIRRTALNPFGADNKGAAAKQKPATKTIRLTFTLPHQDTCPMFNYKEELATAKKKEKLKGGNANTGDQPQNGLDPFEDEADDDVRRIAQEMESKYGGGGPAKKRRKGRRDDYADIGMGYDESDSFIDNTDGYDEIIPQNVTTLMGGFYINCGELEFKTDEEACSDATSSSSSSSSEEEEESSTAKRPNAKRVLESSESEGEKETENNKGSRKLQPCKKLKTVANGEPISKERKLIVPEKMKQLQPQQPKKDENRKKDLLREKKEESNIISSNETSKHSETSEKGGDAMKENKKPTGQVNLNEVTSEIPGDSKALEAKEIVNNKEAAVTNSAKSKEAPEIVPSSEGENSRDSVLEHEKSEAVQLPEQLPSSVLELIDKLKETVAKNADSKLFTAPVNTLLLSLERKCRCLGKQSKSKIYQHLGVAIKCRKEALAKRARNLVLVDDNKRISDFVQQLKVNIDAMMPALLEVYDKECMKIMQKKKESENEAEKDSKQIRMPKRRFTLTEDMKKVLRDVISTKKRCFLLESKKPTTKDVLEGQMMTYLRTEIQTLWPEGWMSMTALTKLYNQFTKSPGDPKVNPNNVPRENLKSVCLNKDLHKLTQSTKDKRVGDKEVLGAKEMQKLASNSMLSIIPVEAAKVVAEKQKERKNELTINKIESSLPIELSSNSALSITPAVITKTKQPKTDSEAKISSKSDAHPLKLTKPPTDHKIENIIKPSPPKTPDLEFHESSPKRVDNMAKLSPKAFVDTLLKSPKTLLPSTNHSKHEEKSKSETHMKSKASYAKTKTDEHSESKPENLSRPRPMDNDVIILEDTMDADRPKNPEMKMIDLTADSLAPSNELKRKPGSKSKTKYYEPGAKPKPSKNSNALEPPSKSYLLTAELDNIVSSGFKEIELLHNNAKKEKNHKEDAAFQEVMENLKHLHQITAPQVKTEANVTSSPVSVIAFNKNFSTPKTSPMSASSSSSTSTITNNATTISKSEIQPDFGFGYQDAFQKQLLNYATSNATSSKNYSGHSNLNSHADKYYPSANNNYTQNSKYKNYTNPSAGTYNLMDDMLANFITEYAAYPKTTANHKPKPPSQK